MNIQRARATSRTVMLTLMLAAFFFIDDTRMSQVWMGTLLALLSMIESALLMLDATSGRSSTSFKDWIIRGDSMTTPATEPALATWLLILGWAGLAHALIR